MQTDQVTVKQGRLFCFLVSTVCDHSGLLWCHAPEKSKCSRIPRFCLQGKGQKGQADAASFSRSRYSQHQRKYTICCFLKWDTHTLVREGVQKKPFFGRSFPNVGGWGGWFPNKVQTPQNPPNHPENRLFRPEFHLSFSQISQKPWGG